jgi:hypothetical protein
LNEQKFDSVLNEPVTLSILDGELAGIAGKLQSAGAPLTFKTDCLGRPGHVTLIPISE